MTLDQALAALGAPPAEAPVEAMRYLLDHWDAAALPCRTLLHDYLAGRDLSEATERALFPILHILGETMDQAAFPAICALAVDAERAGLILGDAAMETLPQILVSCFDGDAAPLRAVIEAPDADPVIREGALMAMAYLVQTKRIPRTEMHAYLVTLHDILPAEPGLILWLGWVRAVALLGFRALAGRAAAVFTRGLISRDQGRVEDFQAELRMALQDPASLDGFFDYGIGPLGSAIAALTDTDEGDGPAAEAPVLNPLRDVGRNDPCPCGSGKKFKRCCLA